MRAVTEQARDILEGSELSPYQRAILDEAWRDHENAGVWCMALSRTSAAAGVPAHVTERAIRHLEEREFGATVEEGHVIILPRRHLHGTPDVWWLRNWVFNHVEGASLVIVPSSVSVAAPFHIAKHAEITRARKSAELFSRLAWGGGMGMEDAWEAAYALAGEA